MLLLAATTVPLQGLPNFLVYLLPRLKSLRTFKGRERIVNEIVSRLSHLTSGGREPRVSSSSEAADFTPQSEIFLEMEAIDALVEESETQDSCEDLPTLIKDLEIDINELDGKNSIPQHNLDDTK